MFHIKNVIFLSFILLTSISFSQELKFFSGTWEEVNDLAAKENKFIMVDAYTHWCGWCEVMDAELFTDSTVVPYLEKHFIPVKIDFEDSLGIILSMKFRVRGYPTLLFFNSHGQLVNKIVGYMQDHAKFLEEVQKIVKIKDDRIYAFDSRELDLDYPSIYKEAFYRKKGYRYPDDSTVTAYLETQEDLFSEINWSIIYKFNSSKYNQYFIDHYKRYLLMYGQSDTENHLTNIIYSQVRGAIDSTDTEKLNEALLLCDKLDDPEKHETFYRMFYYEQIKDWQGYKNMLTSIIDREGIAAHYTINNSCWTLYESTEDKKILEQAIEWMHEVTKSHPIWMYMDTYAALLFKYGDLEKAEEVAEKAIQLGKEEGNERVSSTEKLLEDIRKKRSE